MLPLLSLFSAASPVSQPPHVVYVLTDNLGYGGVGFLRPDSSKEVVTPMLDELAATGVVLESFYTWKFCSPSRCSLLSGRHPTHVNVHNDHLASPGFGIPEEMTLIPRKLKELGYRTHHIGKWHAGFATPARTPHGRGFDSSLGYLFAYNDYLHGNAEMGCENATIPDPYPGVVNVSNPGEAEPGCTSRSVTARHLSHYTDLWEAGDAGEGPATGINGTGFEEAIFLSRAVGIIESHPADEPLFLYYAMHLLHSPLCAPAQWLERFSFIEDNEDRRYVAAMQSYMDDVVGDVVKALKRSGLWDNTVFVWTSDNGAAIELDTGAKSTWPLKGGYYTDWEGGVRAPGLVNGGALPDRQRGRRIDGLIHISDWWPTFVVGVAGGNASDPTAAAVSLPPVDGINQWPYISGAVASSPRTEVLFTPFGFNDTSYKFVNGTAPNNDSAIISVVNGARIKLITGAVAQASWQGPQYPNGTRPENATIGECDPTDPPGCWDTWKTVMHCTVPPNCTAGKPGCKPGCLFNLSADPTEHNDIADAEPGLVMQLHNRLVELSATLFNPDRGDDDYNGICAQAVRNGGFFGPWLPNGVPPV